MGRLHGCAGGMASGFLESSLDCVEGVKGTVDRKTGDGTRLECKISVNQFHMEMYRVRVMAYKQGPGPEGDQWLRFVLSSHSGMLSESITG